ncbi:MAG: hypothetical protein H6882_08640 [Rhodobiaceae bacterium]|nr:hypothetical protein [Rhodobiaceae bacterium]
MAQMSGEELAKWVRTAAELWAQTGNTDDDPVEDEMVRQGCDRDLAWIICEYLPVAFAEHVVENMGVTRLLTYKRRLTDGTEVECKWQDDAVYLMVCRFRDLEAYDRWDEFKKIAARSPELDAINKALMAGTEVEGFVSGVAPFHKLPSDSPWLPLPTTENIQH